MSEKAIDIASCTSSRTGVMLAVCCTDDDAYTYHAPPRAYRVTVSATTSPSVSPEIVCSFVAPSGTESPAAHWAPLGALGAEVADGVVMVVVVSPGVAPLTGP